MLYLWALLTNSLVYSYKRLCYDKEECFWRNGFGEAVEVNLCSLTVTGAMVL